MVEGLLLFCDDAVARQVRRECDRLVFLGNGGDDSEEAQRRLWLRKYRRKGASGSASTNRKLSYEERGVTQAQYKVYWDHYIEPSWQRHGARRLAAVLAEAEEAKGAEDEDEDADDRPDAGSGSVVAKASRLEVIDCHDDVAANAEKLLASGWFGQPRSDDGNNEGDEDEEPQQAKKRHRADGGDDGQFEIY